MRIGDECDERDAHSYYRFLRARARGINGKVRHGRHGRHGLPFPRGYLPRSHRVPPEIDKYIQ
jgi:hypothetical protein